MKNNNLTEETFTEIKKGNYGNMLFFSGSNNANSINQMLVRALFDAMPAKQTRLINLRDFPMPFYADSEEANGIPENTHKLLELIDEYDLLVIAVPEYNHAVPAFFKNALDWISRSRADYRVLLGKNVILLNACPGSGGKDALENAQNILTVLGAQVIGSAVLNEFYNRTQTTKGKIQISCNKFMSEFDAIVHMS